MKCALGSSFHPAHLHHQHYPFIGGSARCCYQSLDLLVSENEMKRVRASIHNYFIHGKMYRKQQTIQIYLILHPSTTGSRRSSRIFQPLALQRTLPLLAALCAEPISTPSHIACHHYCWKDDGAGGRQKGSHFHHPTVVMQVQFPVMRGSGGALVPENTHKFNNVRINKTLQRAVAFAE